MIRTDFVTKFDFCVWKQLSSKVIFVFWYSKRTFHLRLFYLKTKSIQNFRENENLWENFQKKTPFSGKDKRILIDNNIHLVSFFICLKNIIYNEDFAVT
jgi:hypothetical protein